MEEKTLTELRAHLKEQQDNFSNEAVQAVYNILDCIETVYNILDCIEDDEKIDLTELVSDVIKDTFPYYKDAFNYLSDRWIIDFSGAFNNGSGGNVYQIARYYLKEEIFELLNTIGAYN